MYFVIVIDSRHHGQAVYFDQTEPTVLKNLRTEATEWAEFTVAQAACNQLQAGLAPFRRASVHHDELHFSLIHDEHGRRL
jgi:hypothetical protein